MSKQFDSKKESVSLINKAFLKDNISVPFEKKYNDLEKKYKVAYQTGLELVTIRYFDQSTIDRVMINKELILEQRGVQNIELLIRDLG